MHAKIEQSDDELQRLQLRQQLLDLENPSTEGYQEAFVEHAKAWADKSGISADAFVAEGVPAAVLRRAGFRGVSGGRRSTRSRRTTTTTRPESTRSRVSADEVRAAIPNDSFTVKDLQERSGASAAVVVRVRPIMSHRVRRIVSVRPGVATRAGRLTRERPTVPRKGPARGQAR